MAALYGGIEAGGTKFVCAVGAGPEHILAETTFPTTTPAETLAKAILFFREFAHGELLSIGVGSFGPVDPNPNSATFGYITTTPKAGWSNFNIVGELQAALHVPVAFDTDVNAAALGEGLWGAGRSRDPLVYITVGTGIGGGLLCRGAPVHGLLHPEFGHMYLPHDYTADPFRGACPFHGDCLEGLAAGPALETRWGQRGETLPPDHQAWRLEAHYLGLAVCNLIFAVAPQAVILGGGVLDQPGLLEMIRGETERLLKGYIRSPWLKPGLEDFVVRPGLGRRAGVLGAIALALTEDWR